MPSPSIQSPSIARRLPTDRMEPPRESKRGRGAFPAPPDRGAPPPASVPFPGQVAPPPPPPGASMAPPFMIGGSPAPPRLELHDLGHNQQPPAFHGAPAQVQAPSDPWGNAVGRGVPPPPDTTQVPPQPAMQQPFAAGNYTQSPAAAATMTHGSFQSRSRHSPFTPTSTAGQEAWHPVSRAGRYNVSEQPCQQVNHANCTDTLCVCMRTSRHCMARIGSVWDRTRAVSRRTTASTTSARWRLMTLRAGRPLRKASQAVSGTRRRSTTTSLTEQALFATRTERARSGSGRLFLRS